MNTLDTQNKMIREFLEQGNAINPMIALNRFGCFRLSARIHDLRTTGMNIGMTRKMNSKGNYYAEYRLMEETDEQGNNKQV